MSSKRAAEQQLRRKLLPEPKKQKTSNNEENDDEFIELQTFKFIDSQELCEEGMNSGFLITCKYNKEKSCTRELLKRIRSSNFEFKSRIVKLGCNGVVLIMFEKLDVESLIQFYRKKIILGERFVFAQRVTPILKLIKIEKELIGEKVQQATRDFFSTQNNVLHNLKQQQNANKQQMQCNFLSNKQLQKKDNENILDCSDLEAKQREDLHQSKNQSCQSKKEQQQQENHQMQQPQEKLRQQKQELSVNTFENVQKQKQSQNTGKTDIDQNQQNIQKEQFDTNQQIQQSNQQIKIQQQDDVNTDVVTRYAIGVRTRGGSKNSGDDFPINRKQLVDLSSQGFLKGSQNVNFQVDLKTPQIVLMLECVPLANETLLGIGLLKGEWCVAKPRLQPNMLVQDEKQQK
eukprot:TRINITY_DN6758_c1_g1_i1.p1 TRINITY_DN6758_c1_g1~~TRINITY_DN6758_c1_g1_i1.p1  ORF type:complete len:411 (-),score=51.68 TRINITY_DN6758_c1_g1_i1:181-1386(-)